MEKFVEEKLQILRSEDGWESWGDHEGAATYEIKMGQGAGTQKVVMKKPFPYPPDVVLECMYNTKYHPMENSEVELSVIFKTLPAEGRNIHDFVYQVLQPPGYFVSKRAMFIERRFLVREDGSFSLVAIPVSEEEIRNMDEAGEWLADAERKSCIRSEITQTIDVKKGERDVESQIVLSSLTIFGGWMPGIIEGKIRKKIAVRFTERILKPCSLIVKGSEE